MSSVGNKIMVHCGKIENIVFIFQLKVITSTCLIARETIYSQARSKSYAKTGNYSRPRCKYPLFHYCDYPCKMNKQSHQSPNDVL